MDISFHKNFKKQFKKLPTKIQDQFVERLSIFKSDSEHPTLHIHPLKGDMRRFMSMNVTGDHRALFIRDGKAVAFHKIGTHSELYPS